MAAREDELGERVLIEASVVQGESKGVVTAEAHRVVAPDAPAA